MRRLARLSLTTPNADRLAAFYERALGFRRLAVERAAGADFEALMGVRGGAHIVTLGLGREIVELVQFDSPGRPYPDRPASSDLIFQHFAIVVSDMGPAYQRLAAAGEWTSISTGGPVGLPAPSGGVTAFKFRDPDGHPLELLGFADGRTPPRWRAANPRTDLGLGIDHTAISVGDTARSVGFYEALGLTVTARSLNHGAAQARLDNVRRPVVDVIALAPDEPTPHVELLGYRDARQEPGPVRHENDVVATRMVFETGGVRPGSDSPPTRLTYDPDGHGLILMSSVI